jgi:head-tail adaptor
VALSSIDPNRATIGSYRHVVTLDEPGPPISDPDGGFVPSWLPLDPPDWRCAIQPPSTRLRSFESIGGGSVIAQATHVITGRYHPGITSQTRITFKGRTFNVLYASNVDERDRTTELLAAEVVP